MNWDPDQDDILVVVAVFALLFVVIPVYAAVVAG